MKEGKFERVDGENEGVDSENEGVDNDDLPPELRGYCLWNIPTINYNYGRSNWRYMGWRKLIVDSYTFHNFAKAYTNIFNAITTFFEHTTPTNIITNETILSKYSTKQEIKVFGQKGETAVQKQMTTVSWPHSCRYKEDSIPHL